MPTSKVDKSNAIFTVTPWAVKMFVEERFTLSPKNQKIIRETPYSFGFDGYGELVYYRTYSRKKQDGGQEKWPDTVIRVVNGMFSVIKDIRKRKIAVRYDDDSSQTMALECALSMLKMHWLPPGRGLWIGGTDFMYEKGAAALMNCGYVASDIAKNDFVKKCGWIMDMLMCGVGVGFDATPSCTFIYDADKMPKLPPIQYTVEDSREGWVHSTELVIDSSLFQNREVTIDYSLVRPYGAPIKGFGGTASGPAPLIQLHERIRSVGIQLKNKEIDPTRATADIINMIGACVVAGNVRRSAQIALGKPNDLTFFDLKNKKIYPERDPWSWLSNNSVVFSKISDFSKLKEVAERICSNGEPGFLNMLNIQKYARYGKEKFDNATGANPCSEIPLADFELCCLSEVFPGKCATEKEIDSAFYFATLYATTMSTLMTHREESNRIINENHRIGVSISGLSELLDTMGASNLIANLRKWYKNVDVVNANLCRGFGIRESIRKTTVKPSGTISLLAGVSAGMHFPTFKFAKRRTRIGANTPFGEFIQRSGVELQTEKHDPNTLILETPVYNGKAREAKEVSAWEQIAFQALLQREWADNMVSCTVYFDPEKESKHVESLLAQFAPVLKSTSMLPHSDESCYENPPYEGITEEEYHKLNENNLRLDWSEFNGSDGSVEKYCNNDVCSI